MGGAGAGTAGICRALARRIVQGLRSCRIPQQVEVIEMKILITEGSSITARELLFSLGPHHTIDILDPSALCQARFSRFVRRCFRCPPYTTEPQAYLDFLLERLRAESYDAVLPSHEQMYLLARVRDRFEGLTGLAVPHFDDLHRVFGKAEFARLMTELGLPTPATTIVESRDELLRYDDFPCFVKVDYGTAGKSVSPAANPQDLLRIADEYDRAGWFGAGREVVIQRRAEGVQSVFYAVFQHGRMVAHHCVELRLPGTSGWASCGQSARHPVVDEQVARIGAELNWHGGIFFDYFYDPASGQPQFIECNPRIGGTFHSQLSGVDLAGQFLKVSVGESVEPLPPGKVGVRFHQSMLMLMTAAIQGAGRRELLRHLWRRWQGRGLYAESHETLARPREDWLSGIPAAAVTGLLLARPQAAQWLVDRTVDNYALSEPSARAIRDMQP